MSDLVERLLAKDANWQELCNRWESQAREGGGVDSDTLAAFGKMRETTEAEAAREIESLRASLSQEREARESAELALTHEIRIKCDAIAEFRKAEASLAEAKRLLKPFADAKGYFDGYVKDDDLVFVALRNIKAHQIRAAARFLAQEPSE